MTNPLVSGSNPIVNRYDFAFLFDVKSGNPNGDPDNDNAPRVDQETGHGIVTDVCLKRKIRDYVTIFNDDAGIAGRSIYISDGAVLNRRHQDAYDALGLKAGSDGEDADAESGAKAGKAAKGRSAVVDKVALARDYMTRTYFDVRTFGAVMSTGVDAGRVTGPVQITCARSVDPIPLEQMTITRMAVTTEADAAKNKESTMGRKHIVPYGLYLAHGFISAHHAAKTGFSEADLALLWDALRFTWDHDRSAARGVMAARGLYVFKHDSKLGNAPAIDLLDRVTAVAKVDHPRSFSDYAVNVDVANMPGHVTLLRLLG